MRPEMNIYFWYNGLGIYSKTIHLLLASLILYKLHGYTVKWQKIKFLIYLKNVLIIHTQSLYLSTYRYFLIVKLCVHFVSVCLSVQKWTQTETKVTFHPPVHQKTFLVSNERYGRNKTFLLRCYGIDFAPIKRYHPFYFFMIILWWCKRLIYS